MHTRTLTAAMTVAFVGVVSIATAKPKTKPKPAKDETKAVLAVLGSRTPTPDHCTKLPRAVFNRAAVMRDLPLFWKADANHTQVLEAGELAVTWRTGGSGSGWLVDQHPGPPVFGPAFEDACKEILDAARPMLEGVPLSLAATASAEDKRRNAVARELAQGRPTLVLTDARTWPDSDKVFLKHMVRAAGGIERLFARQSGTLGLDGKIPADDKASRALFRRNQGPWCEAPATEADPDCHALAEKPKKVSGLYPRELQADKQFCDTLAKRKDAGEVLHQFAMVAVARNGDPLPVPYHDAYKDDMAAVSAALTDAAAALTNPAEQNLVLYLRAAAQAFLDGSWFAADVHWANMNATNSNWYLRIGPDETYHEPCSRKAGFHMSFARIDQSSLAWQAKLDPVKQDMETALAELAGKPYAARKVEFHLPDFIHIVLNAGDSRSALGATVGQSLPNWGPVADGKGRTVAMTNVYTDPDSKAALRSQVESLFCPQAMATFPDEPGPQVMSTVLHEAAHNLGPAHEYKALQADGKALTDDEAFGGPLAATLEELKAQTAALWLADWLVGKGKLSDQERKVAHTADFAWGLGHVANGLWSPEGKPKPYSQLAAIQIGWLLREKALVWSATATAANGSDKGCFEIRHEAMPNAVEKLMREVAGIKARGDNKAALALRKALVEGGDKTWQKLRGQVVKERWLRAPKASFVYGWEGI